MATQRENEGRHRRLLHLVGFTQRADNSTPKTSGAGPYHERLAPS
jgi:hypothetical protein